MSFDKKINNNAFKKKVSLWFKTSQKGQQYIRVCVTDSDGQETWVGLFENKKRKTENSPDYTGVEFFKEQDYINPKPKTSAFKTETVKTFEQPNIQPKSKFSVIKTEPEQETTPAIINALDEIPF